MDGFDLLISLFNLSQQAFHADVNSIIAVNSCEKICFDVTGFALNFLENV